MTQLGSLIRICSISIILCVGYALNLNSILRAFLKKEITAEIWPITYISSSGWLFCLCIFMIGTAIFGGRCVRLFHSKFHTIIICLSFFFGAAGYIACIVITLLSPQKTSYSKYICWQYELLYILLPFYLIILIYAYSNSNIPHSYRGYRRFTQVFNLMLFSLMLFVTPCIDLVLIFLNNSNNIEDVYIERWQISAYISICTATSILAMTQIICMFKHYNSGLFLKLCIIAALTYGVAVLIAKRIDFDKYEHSYRIHYYYLLLIILCIIYSIEIFIPGHKRVLQMELPHSETIQLDRVKEIEYDLSVFSDTPDEFKGILELTNIIKSKEEKPEENLPIIKEKKIYNPNEQIDSVIKFFPDFAPCKENRNTYFDEFRIKEINKYDENKQEYIIGLSDKPKDKKKGVRRLSDKDRLADSIAAIVPFYNEKAAELHATLRSLYYAFEFIKKKDDKYKYTHFNVLLVGDGWFKADISSKRYLTQLYNISGEDAEQFNNLNNWKSQGHKHNTCILQTKYNQKLCINPFNNELKKLFLKVTTIIKIDNRKKANSHEWFLGKYGFAEWCQCDYMYFTDAYSTCSPESLYRMMQHMKEPKNSDVVCCTGRARVYSIEQELEFQNMLRETITQSNEYSEQKYSDDEDIKTPFYEWWQNDIFKKENEEKVDLEPEDEKKPDADVFYKIQETEFDQRLSTNAHLRDCQMFEFEALYGTIGCYLLGGFLPVIPGPCGFYRSKYVLKDEVRGWYFEKINQKNDPENMDLVLGNMKLAEDRILTVSSILNVDQSVRHSLIPECIFYFDPMQNMTQLMKQRRRWLNGSIATVIFILKKISFSQWNVSVFRRYYVLSMWYMQLMMYCVVALSPPLIFIIAYRYGLATILDVILIDHNGKKVQKINIITMFFVCLSWLLYLAFIYFMQRGKDLKFKWFTIHKSAIVQTQLVLSYMYGILILTGTLIQIIQIFRLDTVEDEGSLIADWFNVIVIAIEILFFLQSFILAPLVSKDFKTFTILLKTCVNYFMYSPFYVTFFLINAFANIHDLSWGTRPDKQAEDETTTNPKQMTYKLLTIVIFSNILIAILIKPLTEYVWAHIVLFAILAFPSLYQIFFSLLWLTTTRLNDLWNLCKPKKLKDRIDYNKVYDLD